MEETETGFEVAQASSPETPSRRETPEYDRGDLEARLRNEPDFAVQEYKKLQAALSREQQRGKQLSKLAQAAQLVGGDDLEAGVDALFGYVERQYRIEQDPTMKRYIEDWINTGRVPQVQREDPYEDEQFLTPEEKKIRELEDTVTQLRNQVDSTAVKTARQEIQGHIKSFFDTKIGKALTEEERADVFRAFDRNFEQWAKTPQGRQQLANMNAHAVNVIAYNWLGENDKLLEIGERISRMKDEHRKSASTDGPTGVAARETGKNGVDPKQMMLEMARDLGIDLYRPHLK